MLSQYKVGCGCMFVVLTLWIRGDPAVLRILRAYIYIPLSWRVSVRVKMPGGRSRAGSRITQEEVKAGTAALEEVQAEIRTREVEAGRDLVEIGGASVEDSGRWPASHGRRVNWSVSRRVARKRWGHFELSRCHLFLFVRRMRRQLWQCSALATAWSFLMLLKNFSFSSWSELFVVWEAAFMFTHTGEVESLLFFLSEIRSGRNGTTCLWYLYPNF